MSDDSNPAEQWVAEERARRQALAHPPFWTQGNCPICDLAGHGYDWRLVCLPAYALTGAIVDLASTDQNKVAGSGLLLADRVVLTAARVLQDRDPLKLRFRRPFGIGPSGGLDGVVEAAAIPRSGVRYEDPTDLGLLAALDSSDLALLRLSSASDWNAGAERGWVPLAPCPDAVHVAYLTAHPEARGSGECAFADAVLLSYYQEGSEYLTPVQYTAVSGNGSVLVLFADHQQGEINARFGGVYSPAMDVGAPVVQVGSTAIRPEVVAVVSGALDIAGDGVRYRTTRVDRWAGWISDTLGAWFPAAPQPPLPGWTPTRARRSGSLLASAVALAVGASGLLILGR